MIKNVEKKVSVLLFICFCIFVSSKNIMVYADTIVPDGFSVIDKENSGDFLNDAINNLIENGSKHIFIKNGTYKLNSMININKSDVILMGEDKNQTKIIQTKPNCDSIGVTNVSNIIVSDLTVDNSVNGSTVFSEGNSDNVTLKNCILYGQDNIFTVFFSGKKYPNSTSKDPVKGLENNDLDANNSIINTTIYSKFNGDGLSFSAQKNGLVENNEVYGTKIALYVCKDSKVIDNVITDSVTNGIAISIPAIDNIISGNIIQNTKASGISVSPESEYPVPRSYYGKNITISNNTIKDSHYMGIEIGQLYNSNIIRNTIDRTDDDGIYLLFADKLSVKQNIILNSGNSLIIGDLWRWDDSLNSGVFMDYSVKNSTIDSNDLINMYTKCPFGIREEKGNLNEHNSVSNNKVLGKFTYTISLADNSNL